MAKKSRYHNSLPFVASAGVVGFAGDRARAIGTATPVVEHTIEISDRLDLLADHYYGDDRMWWRIVDANPEFLFAGALLADDMTGQVIFIPRGKE
jgi:hypothetical protein